MNYDNIPDTLRALRQFCVRVEKQPYVKGRRGFISRGWSKNKGNWLTFEEGLAAIERKETVIFQDKPRAVEALGFLMNRESGQPRPVLIGGDLDCCRDPETGALSPWADDFIMKVLPFYTEISPSKCGIRFFVMGSIGRDKLTGEGPQTDMSDETRQKIFAIKPTALAKFNKGEATFNAFELYESGRHLSLTGDRIDDMCFPVEDRTSALVKTVADWMLKEKPNDENKNNPSNESSLPPIHILDVIDTKDFISSGGQLLGPHPTLGSTTGKNLVVNPTLNVYCYMHNGLNAGGDAWVWLACESGAVAWEKAKAGVLKDRATLEKTLAYAVSKGLISEAEAKVDLNSAVKKVNLDSKFWDIGMYEHNNTLVRIEPSKKDATKKTAVWLSDCVVWIDTELKNQNDTEYIFRGVGARDGREVKFELPAVALADNKRFRSELLNAFGGQNRIGELEFEHVQLVTKHIKHVMKVTNPRWEDNVPLIPGYETELDTEFKLHSAIMAEVIPGDIELAKEALRRFMNIHKYACIIAATSLGAAAAARWLPRERYALGIWGPSGTLKTVCATYAMGFWGKDYLLGPNLKAGKQGSTVNAAMDIFKSAGFLPQIYDNLKAINKKDVDLYVGLIHSIMEGFGKARLDKDSKYKETTAYHSTPIITGEVAPMESSTSARVLGLNWVMTHQELTHAYKAAEELRKIQDNLPIIGYHWIKFLHETDEVLGKEYYAYRSAMNEKLKNQGFSNSGRLGSIVAMLKSIWALLEVSPLGDVFVEYRPKFVKALDSVITEQGEVVSEETDASRFLTGLQELISSSPMIIQGQNTTAVISGGANSIIGKWTAEGLFIVPNLALKKITDLGVFEQLPTEISMGRALFEKGALIAQKDRLKYQMRFNGVHVRGWMIKDKFVNRLRELPPVTNDTKKP